MKYFTLEQLSEINEGQEKPARFVVIGNPVKHSLSPSFINRLSINWEKMRAISAWKLKKERWLKHFKSSLTPESVAST